MVQTIQQGIPTCVSIYEINGTITGVNVEFCFWYVFELPIVATACGGRLLVSILLVHFIVFPDGLQVISVTASSATFQLQEDR